MPARRDVVVELVLMASVLVAAGVLFALGLGVPADYDEGSYLAAADALRHGQELGSDIFTPQPPVFYYLVAVADTISGSSLDGVRAGIVFFALLGLVGAYLIGRLFAGRWGGIAAAALLAVAHPYPTFAWRVSADLPALALALLGVAAFLHAARARRHGEVLAAAAGVLTAASILTKLSAATVLLPLALYAAFLQMRPRRLGAFGIGAAALALAVLLPQAGALDDIWRGAVSYHGAARDVAGPGFRANLEHFGHLIDPRAKNALFWLAPLGILSALALPRAGVRLRLPLWPLWLWALVGELFLLWHKPLHDNHDVLLAVTFAPPVAISVVAGLRLVPHRRDMLLGAGVVALVLAGGYAKEARELVRAHAAEPADVRWAARALKARTAPDELVATDRPIIAYLARRQLPGDLVDTAYLRFRSGYLTADEVMRDLDEAHVRVVVAARAFRDEGGVKERLERAFPTRFRHGGVTLYLRPPP